MQTTGRVRLSAIALTLTLLAVAAGFASPTAAASATCDYDGSKHKVTIVVSGTENIEIKRYADGHILVANVWCENKATVTNTDKINIFGTNGNQHVDLNLRYGGFKPGYTDESGGSDEIEIAISMGGGDNDAVYIADDNTDGHLRFGRGAGSYVLGQANLNSNERYGVDADLTFILGVEMITINGAYGNDQISGQGGAGTGDPFPQRLIIYGNFGNDTLIGTAMHDQLLGDAGNDTLKGMGGPDYIRSDDGVDGNDNVYGGKGPGDTCITDPGDFKKGC